MQLRNFFLLAIADEAGCCTAVSSSRLASQVLSFTASATGFFLMVQHSS